MLILFYCPVLLAVVSVLKKMGSVKYIRDTNPYY